MKRIYGLNTKLDFGEFNGDKLGDVVRWKSSRILWYLDNIPGFKITKNAMDLLLHYENRFRARMGWGIIIYDNKRFTTLS